MDRESINPRYQAFEKFISGMYLGEITRNILLALIDAAPKPLLFNGKASTVLNTHYGLDTAVMSEVEDAWESNREAEIKAHGQPDWQSAHFTDVEALGPQDVARLERIRGIIVQRLMLDPEDVSLRDAATVRWAASLVANRAARLSGTAVAAVLVQTGHAKLGGGTPEPEKNIIIGVDGRCVARELWWVGCCSEANPCVCSLIQHYPNFQARLRLSLRALVGEPVEKRVEIDLAKDGSGAGGTFRSDCLLSVCSSLCAVAAALCALQAVKQGL